VPNKGERALTTNVARLINDRYRSIAGITERGRSKTFDGGSRGELDSRRKAIRVVSGSERVERWFSERKRLKVERKKWWCGFR
jgi:hypothetical protein